MDNLCSFALVTKQIIVQRRKKCILLDLYFCNNCLYSVNFIGFVRTNVWILLLCFHSRIRFTTVRVSAKYHGIRLDYQDLRHTVLDLLAQLNIKLRTWKRGYVSQEAVRVLLKDWNVSGNVKDSIKLRNVFPYVKGKKDFVRSCRRPSTSRDCLLCWKKLFASSDTSLTNIPASLLWVSECFLAKWHKNHKIKARMFHLWKRLWW